MRKLTKVAAAAIVALSASAVGVSSASAGATLNGGGSTFMQNMQEKCISLYNGDSAFNANSDVVSYSGVGSGTGKTNFANGTFKFGGTGSLYSSGAPSNFVYVPLIAGALSVMYRLDGVTPATETVRLSPLTVGKIFAGQIQMWNDEAIVADNTAKTSPAIVKGTKAGVTVTIKKTGAKVTVNVKATAAALKKFKGKGVVFAQTTVKKKHSTSGAASALKATLTQTFKYAKGDIYTVKVGTTSIAAVGVSAIVSGTTLKLPAVPIRVAYRSGNSGTTNNFTNFLNKSVGTLWTKNASDSFTSAIPTSIPTNGTFQAASGSDGVANYVRDNNGAITYTEQSFADERKSATIKSALIKNNAGIYVGPSSTGSAAFYAEAGVDASGVVTPDFGVQAADAYLINAIAYGLASTTNNADNAAVKSYFDYFLGKCAPAAAATKGYAALSGSILMKALAQVAKIASV